MNASDNIKDKLKLIPELPGIYKMLDSGRNIIYIGKSKCLKKRVQSYFTNSPKWEKVNKMVALIKDIEYIVTDTHLEARLLECKLIKEIQPRFNAQMKNDQRYIYIKVETYNPYHPLSIVSTREENCFGPFRSRYSISEFLNSLKNIYPIDRIEDQYKLEYHIFPVTLDQEVFDRNRSVLLNLLTEPIQIQYLIEALQIKLEEAVESYRYEMAAIYRDMMKGFSIIRYGLEGYQSMASRNILLKLPITFGFKLFFLSNGNIINEQTIPDLSDDAISHFIRESTTLVSTFNYALYDEKSQIDFRDILYSEVSDLSEDMVVVL